MVGILNISNALCFVLITLSGAVYAGSLERLSDAEADAIVLAEETAKAERKAALRAKLDAADILSEGETVLPSGQRVLVREVRPPEPVPGSQDACPAPEPKPSSSAESLTTFQAAQAKAQHTLQLSIGIHETVSYIRWRYEDADYAIWSPIQAKHLSALFEVESETARYMVLMGIGPAADTHTPPPELSDLPTDRYLVVEGDPNHAAAFAGIETVIDYYTANAEALHTRTQRREALAAARKRYAAAHPKPDVPEDFVFQFWIPEKEGSEVNTHRVKARILPALVVAPALLTATVVPDEALYKHRDEMGLSASHSSPGVITLTWQSLPDVYYYAAGTNHLSHGISWIPAKLLTDLDPSDGLMLSTQMSGGMGFYKLDMIGDSGHARLRSDSDEDGIIDLLEVRAGWDAFEVPESTDSDSDGIPDYFEQFHFGTLVHHAGYVARTGGLTLAEAFANATNPTVADSDNDGLSDAAELAAGSDPNYDQSRDDPNGDPDNDGLTSAEERTLGSQPFNPDSDSDSLKDGQDAVPTDPLIRWQRMPLPGYVLVPTGMTDTALGVRSCQQYECSRRSMLRDPTNLNRPG